MAVMSTPGRLPAQDTGRGATGDPAFRRVALILATSVIIVVIAMLINMTWESRQSLNQFGLGFLIGQVWDPVHLVFGALPFIYGTVITSLIALLLAGFIGLGTAIFLAEIAPGWIRTPLSFLVELLAAIPSVVYGVWGIFILGPFLKSNVVPGLKAAFGFTPFFSGTFYGPSILTASLVLTIMVLPIVAAVSRDVILTVPASQREAMIGLGATRWEVISRAVLPYARTGILGAMILGLGRALGETMAVTMLIGNRGQITPSLFKFGDTLASVLANQFAEAQAGLQKSSLIELALILLVISLAVNAVARLLVSRAGKSQGAGRI
ncbi:MAG: phosphate ABC transporter permease subunit PstC [Chloroflexota bacterium]|nr:phosphate ABC transporter permease subunit PstC [Chloroflexota bacterium]